MPRTRTVYDVITRYRVDDKGRRGFAGIERGAQRASRATGMLGSTLRNVIGGYLAGRALGAAKRALIDYNSRIQQATISLAFQQRLMDKGLGWQQAKRDAAGYFDFYQQVAKKSVGETEDFLSMHQQIAAVAKQYGFIGGEVKDLTKGATIVSQVLGERADLVGLDIKQMIAGQVTARDRVAKLLLASQNVDSRTFNKMAAAQRRGVMMRALKDPAIAEAAKEMEGSFAGVTSTLMDNLKIAFGKVGLPLMKRITAEVKRWNAWIDKNPEKIERFAKRFGDALARGFEAIQGVASWVSENRGLLLKLAEAMLVLKGARMVGGALAAAGGGIRAGGIGSKLQTATFAVGTAYLVANSIKKGLEDRERDEQEAFGRQRGFDTIAREMNRRLEQGDTRNAQLMAKLLIKEGGELGMIDPRTGRIRTGGTAGEAAAGGEAYRRNRGAVGKIWDSIMGPTEVAQKQLSEGQKMARRNTEELTKALLLYNDAVGKTNFRVERFLGLAKTGRVFRTSFTQEEIDRVTVEPIRDPEKRRKPPGGDQNITINKVEVAAADPDRFVFDFERALDKINRNPTQARSALEGGF